MSVSYFTHPHDTYHNLEHTRCTLAHHVKRWVNSVRSGKQLFSFTTMNVINVIYVKGKDKFKNSFENKPLLFKIKTTLSFKV